jgi:predicted HTH domain antitoxin
VNAQIAISYPESLALSLKMDNHEFEKEMKVLSLVKLYEMGKISSGIAARLLNLTRIEFLDLLAKYRVSYFQNDLGNELMSDFKNA